MIHGSARGSLFGSFIASFGSYLPNFPPPVVVPQQSLVAFAPKSPPPHGRTKFSLIRRWILFRFTPRRAHSQATRAYKHTYTP